MTVDGRSDVKTGECKECGTLSVLTKSSKYKLCIYCDPKAFESVEETKPGSAKQEPDNKFRNITLMEQEAMVLAYQEGSVLTIIAREAGTSPPMVQAVLRHHKVQLRSRGYYTEGVPVVHGAYDRHLAQLKEERGEHGKHTP